jgi:hypothetical protein
MGYEYRVVFTPSLGPPQVMQLLQQLQTAHSWLLVQVVQENGHHLLGYAYAASGPIAWDEDFLLEVSPEALYVLLHSATRNQEASVLAWLQDCVATLGLIGTLAEV